MGAGGLIASLVTIGGSAAAFFVILQQQRAKPACVWVWAGANQTGAKACLPAGATSVPFTPKSVRCPKGLALAIQLQAADSAVTNLSVGSGSTAELGGAISASQSIKSVSVAAV